MMSMRNTEDRNKAAGRKEDKLPMLQAMLLCKCPRCTRGDMFKTSAFDLGRFNELKEACEACGLRYQVEPGFYQLSMYLTYAISIGLIAGFSIAAYLIFDDPPLWVFYAFIFIPLILTTPWNIRYSKVIMLYFFGNVWESGRKS